MSRNLYWGIIGPGRIAHKFAQAVKGMEGQVLQAVGSRNQQRAEVFAHQYHIPNVYGSYSEVVKDPSVDVVYIATPHRYHAEEIIMALDHGKPVLCEKPLTVTTREAEQVLSLAQKKNLFVMEALWSRFLASWQQVKSWVTEKAIGDMVHISTTFGFPLPKDPKERWLNPDLAGGTLLDMGIYPIALSQFVTGKYPTSFSANCLKGDTGVDVLTAVNLQYDNQIISQFTTNFLVKNSNESWIYGTKGMIHIHNPFWEAQRVTLISEDDRLTQEFPHIINGFEYQIMEVGQCVQQGRIQSRIMPWQETLDNLRLMDQIRQTLAIRYPFE